MSCYSATPNTHCNIYFQSKWRTNTISYNIDAFYVERNLKTNFTIYIIFDTFDTLLPSETVKQNGRKCYQHEFCVIFKLCLNVLEWRFCVWSMDNSFAWNEWKMLLDAKISVFEWFMVFLSRRHHPPLPVRDNCPVWLWRNDQTMRLDNWFGVCLWQSYYNSSDIFLTLQCIEWRLKSWFLVSKYIHCFQKIKQSQNSVVRDEIVCLPV